MKNTIKYIMVAAAFVMAVSCHYLDKAPESEGYSPEEIFSDSLFYRAYCEQLVENAPIEHLFFSATPSAPQGSFDCVSDNSLSEVQNNTCPSRVTAAGNFNSLRTSSTAIMASDATWDKMWKNVRIANNGIRNIHLFNGSDEERDKILGMCYFYRAYLYHDLCRRWGGMPYMWKPITDGSKNLDYPRLSMQKTFKYAAIDCDSAAVYLKNTIPNSEFQHPTRVAALALKSRCLLYAASDQARTEENGESENLWEEAAMAADAAIRAAEDESDGKYSLVSGDNYYNIFKGDDETYYLKEILFGRRSNKPWANNAYRNNCGRPPGQLQGNFGTAPNQTLIDSYEMAATGLPITEPDSGYKEQDPYTGRDKRFYHDIVFNGHTVMDRKINIWNFDEETQTLGVPGDNSSLKYSGPKIDAGYTETGTYANKWLGKAYNSALPCHWPYIRLSELYLNFAEAANEAWATPTVKTTGCKHSAKDALNKVRTRAGLKELDSRFYSSDKFRDRTRNERRVEFCFEEHRIFDIRRWLIAELPEYRDIYGVYITKLAPGYDALTYPTGFKYDRQLVMTRAHEKRHYLWPVKEDDANIGPNFKQNPGW